MSANVRGAAAVHATEQESAGANTCPMGAGCSVGDVMAEQVDPKIQPSEMQQKRLRAADAAENPPASAIVKAPPGITIERLRQAHYHVIIMRGASTLIRCRCGYSPPAGISIDTPCRKCGGQLMEGLPTFVAAIYRGGQQLQPGEHMGELIGRGAVRETHQDAMADAEQLTHAYDAHVKGKRHYLMSGIKVPKNPQRDAVVGDEAQNSAAEPLPNGQARS